MPNDMRTLVLQAEALVKPSITDAERLEWIAEHFSGLDFGRSQEPDKQSAYIQPDEDDFFTVMHADKGQVAFKRLAVGDFREALDALMGAWK